MPLRHSVSASLKKEIRMTGFYDMMSGWGGGFAGWSMYLGMIVFWIGVVVLIVWGLRALAGPGVARAVPELPRPRQESAVDILKRRYAAGEIDAAEFERKKRDLS
jgi:putative membrane protein